MQAGVLEIAYPILVREEDFKRMQSGVDRKESRMFCIVVAFEVKEINKQ